MTGPAPVALVTGAGGRVGRVLTGRLADRGYVVEGLSHRDLDVGDGRAVTDAMAGRRPAVVVNLAAFTDVDACEAAPTLAERINAAAVASLAAACREVGAHLVHLSTDYVFGGQSCRPYREDDAPRPLSVYGRTKLAGERCAGPDATVVRSAWLAGEEGPSVVRSILELASDPDRELAFVADQVGSPTVVDDLATVLVELIDRRRPGVVHVVNRGGASWYDLARFVVERAGGDPDRVVPITRRAHATEASAPRPARSVLDCAVLRSEGWPPMRPWQEAIGELVARLMA